MSTKFIRTLLEYLQKNSKLGFKNRINLSLMNECLCKTTKDFEMRYTS